MSDHPASNACYTNKGCREPGCREAHRQAMEDYRRSKGVKPSSNRKAAEHGTRSGYKRCTAGPDGGKCEACKQANSDYQREYMRLHRQGVVSSDPWIDQALK